MADSLLEFTRAFEKLKTRLQTIPAFDLKLLELINFRAELSTHSNNPAYRSYVDEYIAYLIHTIENDNFQDLSIDELRSVAETVNQFRDNAEDKLDNIFKKVTVAEAKKLFYVGETEKALSIFENLLNEKFDIEVKPADGGMEFDTFQQLCFQARERYPELYNTLLDILIEWESIRESTRPAGVFCLFVEKNESGKNYRGRMRILEGRVELGAHHESTDEVIFHNQIKTPDDQFVGVAYESLEAVRRLFANLRQLDKTKKGYHAHYSITGCSRTFTGDSIGLAFALTAYTQLIKPDITRYDQYISSETAVTGSIASDGRLVAVNRDSLPSKIERAFFSPVKYVVLPIESMAAAQQHLDNLNEHYPHRRLYLVGHEHLREVIENHNVIRDEKVCAGTLIRRRISRYSRLAKIQVPLLMVLLYVLVCLIYPKAWILLDRNPQQIEITNKGFKVMNENSVKLWDIEFPGISVGTNSRYIIADYDNDGKNEIAFSPRSKAYSKGVANLFVYDHCKSAPIVLNTIILDEYPGDTTLAQLYYPFEIDFINYRNENILISKIGRESPTRTHIRFWRSNGDSLGWYINSGFISKKAVVCFEGKDYERIVFGGINNLTKCAVIIVLDPMTSFGVSPPYINEKNLPLDKVRRGNQVAYITFPQTELSKKKNEDYNYIYNIQPESENVFRVDVMEVGYPRCIINYYFDKNLCIVKVNPDDHYKTLISNMMSDNLIPRESEANHISRLADKVTYWSDTCWVTEGEL